MEQMSPTGQEFGMLKLHGRHLEPLELNDALTGHSCTFFVIRQYLLQIRIFPVLDYFES